MNVMRTAGTGATFVVARDLNDYTNEARRRRIERRKRKALQRIENQTF